MWYTIFQSSDVDTLFMIINKRVLSYFICSVGVTERLFHAVNFVKTLWHFFFFVVGYPVEDVLFSNQIVYLREKKKPYVSLCLTEMYWSCCFSYETGPQSSKGNYEKQKTAANTPYSLVLFQTIIQYFNIARDPFS